MSEGILELLKKSAKPYPQVKLTIELFDKYVKKLKKEKKPKDV